MLLIQLLYKMERIGAKNIKYLILAEKRNENKTKKRRKMEEII